MFKMYRLIKEVANHVTIVLLLYDGNWFYWFPFLYIQLSYFSIVPIHIKKGFLTLSKEAFLFLRTKFYPLITLGFEEGTAFSSSNFKTSPTTCKMCLSGPSFVVIVIDLLILPILLVSYLTSITLL